MFIEKNSLNFDNNHILLSIDKIKGGHSLVKYKCNVYNEEVEQRKDVYILKGCKICNEEKRKIKLRINNNEFVERFNSIDVNGEYELLSKYEKATVKIKVKHKVCNSEYYVNPYKFLGGAKCPKCANYGLSETEFLKKYESSLNDYEVLSNFVNFNTNLKLKHKECNHIFDMKPKKFVIGQRCPKCLKFKSKLEAYTEAFLSLNNISYIREYKIPECRNTYTLPFDFGVFIEEKLFCLIECDGEQHYDKKSRFHSKKIIKNDSIKNDFCEKNNISLLRLRENEFKDFFKILNGYFNVSKKPSDEYIDLFRKTVLNAKLATDIRNEYLKSYSSKDLSKIFKINTVYILSVLNYEIYENQDLEIKEKILEKIKNRKKNRIKLFEHRKDIIEKFEQGLSLRGIAKIYNSNHKQIKKIIKSED